MNILNFSYKKADAYWVTSFFSTFAVYMKNIIQKIFSLALALLLLASTTSWRVEKHFCMGHLVAVALFTEARSCGMDMEMDSDTAIESDELKSCCSQEVIIIDGQDKLKLSFNDINLDQQFFLVALTAYYLDLFPAHTDRNVSNTDYPPPLLVKDIYILDQVFLI